MLDIPRIKTDNTSKRDEKEAESRCQSRASSTTTYKRDGKKRASGQDFSKFGGKQDVSLENKGDNGVAQDSASPAYFEPETSIVDS